VEVLLALQRSAGNAAVTRWLARAPAATPGHEEPSWARPSTTLAAEPVHVATIHFRSKEWAIDASDDAVLKALATAYAPYAGRNVHKPQEPQGLRGRIVGYVDPSEPDKDKLSVRRAVWTGDYLLRHLVRESGVIPGRFDFERVGGGLAPEAGTAAKDDAPAVEANVYAPQRRAEIYLTGKGVERTPEAPADHVDKRVKPPDLGNRDSKRWDFFDPYIELGYAREIRGMAAQILGWTIAGSGGYMDEALEFAPLHKGRRVGHRKPPWWDGRGAEFAEPIARGGMTARQKLIHKGRLLKRDMVETQMWADIHWHDGRGSFVLLYEESKKDAPDWTKIEGYIVNLEYLRFMLDATADEANEILRMTE
jgi:hypothetical protein